MIRPIDAEPEQQDARYDYDDTYGRRRGEHGLPDCAERPPTRAYETPDGGDLHPAPAPLAVARTLGGAVIGMGGHGDTITEIKEGDGGC